LSSLVIENPTAAASSAEALRVQRRDLAWTDPETILMGGLLLAAFVGLFFRWIWAQHLFSMEAPADWGHAYFIPLISGYMIWQKRAELAKIRPQAFWPGLAPLALGMVSYFFFVGARVTGGHMIQGWAVVLSLFGLALLFAGPKAMRHLFLPIAFLVLGIKISEQIMIRLTFPMQLIASQGAYGMLSVLGAMFGFTVDVAGNNLTMTSASGKQIPLSVAEACSGMRMVIAFIALGAATALLSLKDWWQRVLLLLLTIPVAIFLNVIRVAVLGLLSLADEKLAAGEAHTFIGTLLLIPGLFLFLGVVWALKRVVKPAEARA
jgi:exosortase